MELSSTVLTKKTIMKTLAKMMCIFLFIGFVAKSHAQKKEETVYAFCYSYKTGDKLFYVSNIVNGVINSDIYYDVNRDDLQLQWTAKLKTVVNDYYNWANAYGGFHGSTRTDGYDKIDEERTEIIGKFKQEGYTIRYVNTFSFRKSRKEEDH